MKERERQEHYARSVGKMERHTYLCDDGVAFETIAASERHAFLVLNAERPGMRAMYWGCSIVHVVHVG